MARPFRIEFPGALHHVISRGDNRRRIVWDDADRRRRLDWLARVVGQHGWKLHAFCLMTNHEHLFVETPQPNLSVGMQLLNGAYTQYVNFKRHCSGHLFREANRSDLFEAPSDPRAPRKVLSPFRAFADIGATESSGSRTIPVWARFLESKYNESLGYDDARTVAKSLK